MRKLGRGAHEWGSGVCLDSVSEMADKLAEVYSIDGGQRPAVTGASDLPRPHTPHQPAEQRQVRLQKANDAAAAAPAPPGKAARVASSSGNNVAESPPKLDSVTSVGASVTRRCCWACRSPGDG